MPGKENRVTPRNEKPSEAVKCLATDITLRDSPMECSSYREKSLLLKLTALPNSLVSLPGLPQLLPNYKPRDDRKWLSDVLSHQFPAARILTYQYDFAKPSTEACWTKILDHGLDLLYALVHRRTESNEMNRPICMLHIEKYPLSCS